ncbi:MAG: DUF5685 family protein [Jatrophihabitans sp.]|uniref:DUF5685 family protein n=1 Tax=Jatrophihabitans sp. TaxID=1932789 RepID=UPI003F7DD1A9
MFGILRPCRNRFGDELRTRWMGHLCGLCLALRDHHGHMARFVTNYDAVVLSALIEAQQPAVRQRVVGPCALRGLRGATVTDGGAARFAATVSLLLAAGKLDDHLADGDVRGPLRRRTTALVGQRFAAAGGESADALGLDAGALLTAVAEQPHRERAARTLLDASAPTEAATALVFAHTAALAGRPANAPALAEIGGLFGRLAYALDAVDDLAADRRRGAWNPIDRFGLSPGEVRAVCDDAVLGIRLALRDVRLDDASLVHALLVHETEQAVRRSFRATAPAPPPLTPPLPPQQQPPTGWEAPPPPRSRTRVWLASLVACGTCEACGDDPHGRGRCRHCAKDCAGDLCEDGCQCACSHACNGCCSGDGCDCGSCDCGCDCSC